MAFMGVMNCKFTQFKLLNKLKCSLNNSICSFENTTKKHMKLFTIPNLMTGLNMLGGVMAILFALAGRIDIAPYCLFISAILDFFDGFLARLLKQQSELGKQLDSLADVISFGLAPGIIIMVILIYQTTGTVDVLNQSEFMWGQPISIWLSGLTRMDVRAFIPLLALWIPFFSLFRLAKFNIDTRQSESFIGVPTPANTLFFLSFPLLLVHYIGTEGWEHNLILYMIQPTVLVPIIVVMSVSLISEIPLFALKFKGFGWQGNQIRYLFLISCGILIPTLWLWSLPIIVLLYLTMSIVYTLVKKK